MTEIDLRQFAPATRRNRGPLLEVLREGLPARGRILEIASGTGEHAVYFAHAFPDLTWQPSDPAPACRASIEAHRSAAGLANVLAPLDIDSCSADWLMADIDAVFCANMTHIAPWDVTVGLLAGAGRSLKPGGGLLIYGPFIRDDRETAPSNLAFDRSLRARDPSWGLRRLAAIEDLARAQGLSRAEIFEMPANNLTLWFRKRGST